MLTSNWNRKNQIKNNNLIIIFFVYKNIVWGKKTVMVLHNENSQKLYIY